MDTTTFTYITILLYFAISAYQFYLLKKQDGTDTLKIAMMSAIPLLLHGWLLHLAIDTDSGQNLSMFNIFSMMFWLVSILIMVFSCRKKLGILVMTVLPITGLSLLSTVFSSHQTIIDASAPGYLFHTLISIAAISVISFAAIQSLFVNALDNRLRQSPSEQLEGVPALQDMESFLFILIWTGFALLSLSILTAMIFVPHTGNPVPLHKPILSIASWICFVVLLVGRYKNGWRGKVASRWIIAGFTLVFLAYFGTKTVLEFFIG